MLTKQEMNQNAKDIITDSSNIDALNTMSKVYLQATSAIDLAAENERLKAKLDAVRAECKMRQYGVMDSDFDFGLAQMADVIMAIIDKECDET